MKTANKLVAIAVITCTSIWGCKKEQEEPVEQQPVITSGMIIGCEGAFGMSNASIHALYEDGTTGSEVFRAANGVGPGDVLQSYREFREKGYVVMNNSQKVEVVSAPDMQYIASITGVDYPRDVLVLNESVGYISNGSLAGQLITFNPLTNQVTGAINVGNGPEEIVYNGEYIFVANSGGWDFDNSVSVIDPATQQVIATVEVGDRPVALEVDYLNNVWALCKGDIVYDGDWQVIDETQAELIRIDGMQHVVSATLPIGEVGEHPQFMAASGDGQTLYIVNNGVVPFNVATGTLEEMLIQGEFHSIGVNSESNELYLSSVPDFVGNDEVYEYTAGGQLNATYNVGIAPRAFFYRP